ncbi:hypothetical protein [Terrabacter sp. 2YAF2]|uniref:hypothetical protein n=1 Tax=Terrabacter sp. 2YAF2 TaxID=3233026 RepID=UPI003F9A58DF
MADRVRSRLRSPCRAGGHVYPSTRLAAELDGADIAAEIRRYSVAQLLLLVPGLIAAVAVAQARRGWRDRGDAVTTVKGTRAHSDPR